MRYVTAGESHGSYLTSLVLNVPAGIPVSEDNINADLARRSHSHGRSARQAGAPDRVIITAGVRDGRTTGAPVAFMVANAPAGAASGAETDASRVLVSAEDDLDVASDGSAARADAATAAPNAQADATASGLAPAGANPLAPRPGHADLVGALKFGADDCTDAAERASARETAARVAAASIAREFLAELGVDVLSYVTGIGEARMDDPAVFDSCPFTPLDIEMSPVRCPDAAASKAMVAAIDEAREAGDTLGGTFCVVATGLVPGLGGYANGEARLTAQIGAALFGIPAIKGVEFGRGFEGAGMRGSSLHDPIVLDEARGFGRAGNNAGGLEGGMTTGLPLVVRAAMKPIPTLARPLETVSLETLEPVSAATPRADVCAVPAAAVVAEGEVAFVLARAYLAKFGGDNLSDIKAALRLYRQRLKAWVR